MSAEYRYFACDLRTDRTLAELPLSDVSFSYAINDTGDWSATLPLSDDLVQHINPHTSTTPAKTCLWIERNKQLVFGGIIWSRRYKKKDKKFSLAGSDFLSYLSHRHLFADKNYMATTITNAAADVIDYHAKLDHGNIQLVPKIFLEPGIPDTVAGVSYLGVEAKQLFSLLGDLSDIGYGFDFAQDVGYEGNARRRQVSLHYPERGRPVEATQLVFDAGNIADYEWPEDGTDLTTEALVIGAGEGNAMMRSKRTNEAAHAAGYPLIQRDFSYKDVSDQATLDRLGDSALATYDEAYVEVDITLKPDSNLTPGSFVVGDWGEIRIKDERFPMGIRVRQRIVGITVKPPQRGKSEEIQVKFGGPQEHVR